MFISPTAGFRLKEPMPRRIEFSYGFSTPTSFSEGESITWRDMVEAFHDRLSVYICLVLLDDSEANRSLGSIISDRYLDIDRVTGNDLLVLSTVPPPRGWFRQKSNILSRLPAWAQKFHQKEIYLLGTEEGEDRARYNSKEILSEYFDTSVELPALCYLEPRPMIDGSQTSEIEALAYPFSGFRTASQVLSAFTHLAKVASEKRILSTDAFDVAREAHSLLRPVSLRWRNAALKSIQALDFIEDWFKRARSLK